MRVLDGHGSQVPRTHRTATTRVKVHAMRMATKGIVTSVTVRILVLWRVERCVAEQVANPLKKASFSFMAEDGFALP